MPPARIDNFTRSAGFIQAAALLCFLSFCSFQNAYAISPPQNGKFPAGFWSQIERDTTLAKYGDPGWMKRVVGRRQLKAKAARGETLLQAITQDKFKLCVLLGCYKDKTTTYTAGNFNWLLFSDQNPTGSLSKYYDEISYGQFELTGQSYGWFTVDNTQLYYAGNSYGQGEFPNNRAGFVRDVVVKADPTVDFSQYDNDGPDGQPNSGDDDGYVDCVYVVFVGKGPEQGTKGDPDNLWSCQSSLGSNEYETNDFSVNGGNVKVNTWAIAPEIVYYYESENYWIQGIGVFAHEFGHVLGLPDLYDRTDDTEAPDYNDSEGLGQWCLMASGSWGGDGKHPEKPSHMSAWCKMRLGWISPEIVVSNQSISLPQVENTPRVYQLWEDEYRLNRYFLIENRQKTGFDQYLNGDGLLVYHVNESRWFGMHNTSGTDNDDETHKLVDIEEADGLDELDKAENRGDAGDPFPGSSGATIFDNNSHPNSKDYNNNYTGVAVKNISSSGPFMTADVSVRDISGYSIVYDEAGMSGRWYGYGEGKDTWGGVLFTALEDGIISSIDVGFLKDDTDYQLNIYRDFLYAQPTNLIYSTSGRASKGWNTLSINELIFLRKDQNIFVSIKIPYNFSYDRYGDKSNRSYISGNGETYSTSIQNYGNLNIRTRIKTKGVVIAPAITLSDTLLQFANTIKKKSSSSPLTIHNRGNDNLIVSSIYSSSIYFISNATSTTIPPNDSTKVTLSFSPVAIGAYNGILHLKSNDPQSDSLTVKLSGTCIGPQISLSTHSISFGEVFIDSTVSRSLEITNNGLASLNITAVIPSDSIFNPGLRSITLPPGNKTNLQVYFTPRSATRYFGSLMIINNDSTVFVELEGEGKKPPVFLSAMGNETYRVTEGYYQVWVKLSNALTNPKVDLLVSDNGGESFNQRILCSKYNNRYIGAVPARPLGTILHYYFEVADESGETYKYPQNSPETRYRIDVALHKRGDVDDNWTINIFDLLGLLGQLSDPSKQTSQSDVNADGHVNIFDLLEMLKMLSNN